MMITIHRDDDHHVDSGNGDDDGDLGDDDNDHDDDENGEDNSVNRHNVQLHATVPNLHQWKGSLTNRSASGSVWFCIVAHILCCVLHNSLMIKNLAKLAYLKLNHGQ